MGQGDTRDVWLGRVAALRQWRKDGARAPHKPLLLLYALGRFGAGNQGAVSYREAEPSLARLLDEFGPPRKSSPAYPFRRLANDQDLWVVETPSGADPGDSSGRLRELDASGSLSPELVDALHADPALLVLMARFLLDDNWPPSLHEELAAEVGLDLDAAEVALVRGRLIEDQRRRDPAFRERVLMAYEYRCAMCGFDGALDRAAVGLEAAHVRWWSDGGPDTVDNGACLCSLHHVLFDKGVLGVTPDYRVQVSKRFVGRGAMAQALVLDLAGARLLQPQAGELPLAETNLGWHATQVFRDPARGQATPESGRN